MANNSVPQPFTSSGGSNPHTASHPPTSTSQPLLQTPQQPPALQQPVVMSDANLQHQQQQGALNSATPNYSSPVASAPGGGGVPVSYGNTTGGGATTGEFSSTPQGEPKRLHVSNIPFRFREPELRQLFFVSPNYLHCSTVNWPPIGKT